MSSVTDRWTVPNPEKGAKPARIRGPLYGVGKRWQAQWASPNGTRHRMAFEVKGEAQAHIEDQESNKRGGQYVAPNRVTVGDLWPRWQTVKSRLARTTREGYDGAWDLYVGPRWANVPVGEVDKASVMEWLPTLRTPATSRKSRRVGQPATITPGRPLSASWARQVGIVLTGLLDMAVDGRLIPANPLVKIGAAMPKQLPSERRYLSVAEVDQLLADAETVGIGLAVRVLVFTGMRRGEMAGLRVGDLDVERRRLRISRDVDSHGDVDSTKTGRHRDVPIGPTLLALLGEAAAGRDRDDWLVPATGGERPWARDSWRGRWARASAAAGIGGLDTHELRHTAASLAIHAGANVKTVQRMLGHATASMTLDIYGHLWDDELDAVVVAVDLHMDAERARFAPGPNPVPTAAPAGRLHLA
ncbi:Phage integrase family protein [Nakamurella panacisegetis]|uniref:Phage integrase family protein n=1 Tax=Nakamurella panacisegetis TaxID=1090615 RepID=A0A1H0Q1T7_9ACTN|nr:site-specific integrase [Nakamurella panacisegetis]SDP10975.1 Phage integrase family protein [Nakamurella panacisegetis]